MTDDVELLPCPFCGGPAYMLDYVACDHCSAEAKTPEQWNRRVALAAMPQPGVRAGLERALGIVEARWPRGSSLGDAIRAEIAKLPDTPATSASTGVVQRIIDIGNSNPGPTEALKALMAGAQQPDETAALRGEVERLQSTLRFIKRQAEMFAGIMRDTRRTARGWDANGVGLQRYCI